MTTECTSVVDTDNEAMLAIQELMDGVEWSPDTLDQIAQIMEAAGYKIANSDGVEEANIFMSGPVFEPES